MIDTSYFFRFFVSSDDDNETGNRTELLGCLTTGAYSQCHITLSRELALANPELTLPMFCGVCVCGGGGGGGGSDNVCVSFKLCVCLELLC